MSLAPEPYHSACLQVLYVAALEARIIGWNGEHDGTDAEQCRRLVALMDAVHNLPLWLTRWETVDEAELRRFLARFDDRWGDRSSSRLLAIYEQAVEKGQGGLGSAGRFAALPGLPCSR